MCKIHWKFEIFKSSISWEELCLMMFGIVKYILWSFQNRSVDLCPILKPIHFWPLFADKIPSTAKPKQIWLEIDSDEKRNTAISSSKTTSLVSLQADFHMWPVEMKVSKET